MLNRITSFLLFFLQTQLFVTLVSLPFLINWGLGLSLMGIVANLIFSPVITLFITLSSVLFFTELCGFTIPYLGWLINTVIDCWHWLLEHGNQHWLYAFARPSTIELVIIGLLPLIILHRWMDSPKRRITTMIILLMAIISYLNLRQQLWADIPEQIEKIDVIHREHGITMIDRGFFGRKHNPHKAVCFELKPLLAKKYGSTKINHLIISQVSIRSLQGALACCQEMPVKKITLPFFKELDKRGWKLFFELTRLIKQNNIILKRVDNKTPTKKIPRLHQCHTTHKQGIYSKLKRKNRH